MTPQQAELWRTIEVFPLDGGPTTGGFARRLARENRWSRRQAEAAIREYRRFLFLLAGAGHPVSPSPIVDQVWHLHLVYTRSYWDELCRDTVGKPLHHGPSTGAPGETEKFHDWYAKTLASYEEHFGQPPTREIWPPKGTPHPDYRWADARHTWFVPRPRLRFPRGLRAAALLWPIATLAGCSGPVDQGGLGLFDLPGREFLTFFMGLTAITLLLALALRLWAKRDMTGSGATDDSPRQPYELAYLMGGPTRVVNTAVVALARQEQLKLRRTGRKLVQHGLLPENAPSLERVIWTATDEGARVRDVRAAAAWDVEGLSDRLADDGLAIPTDRARATKAAIALLTLTPVVLGISKVIIGVMRDRPVLYLVGLTIVALLLGLCILLPPLRRTWRGDVAVRAAREAHAPLHSGAFVPVADLPLAVALFGITALHGTAYAELQEPLTPRTSSTFTGGGCGSSCGGGGASGGGSCGGGSSCGGGGCGGCGGGG